MGTIFKQRTSGNGNVILHSFNGADGNAPFGGVTLARDGSFYGTTLVGGTFNYGVLFKITASGTLTVLYNFTGGTDGRLPFAAPIQGSDGNFYGTTNGETSQDSTIYQYNPSTGILTTIYTFDAEFASFSPVLQVANGDLYATAEIGGTDGCGAIVKITTAGVVKGVHSFDCLGDGGNSPVGPLVQGSDGNLYGTTMGGGTYREGTVFKMDGKSGQVTVLYSFGATAGDGVGPQAGLVQGTDGNFYGATTGGGAENAGTLFQLASGGAYSQLYSFTASPDLTQDALGAPLQYTGGLFYGVTELGGSSSLGMIYTLDMGLGPFIAFVRAQGKVGATAQILGTGLTSASSVTFNGVPAAGFSVSSDTYMTAVVPAGATTGPVVVTTPGGTLTSNVSFRVTQ
jgi:uncharacterized repeat protein (TIGR03803 family)